MPRLEPLRETILTRPAYTALAGCNDCDWQVEEAAEPRKVRKKARYHTQTRGHRTVVVSMRRLTYTKENWGAPDPTAYQSTKEQP